MSGSEKDRKGKGGSESESETTTTRKYPSRDEETQRDTTRVKIRKDTYVAEATTDEALETAREVTVPRTTNTQRSAFLKARPTLQGVLIKLT